MNRQAQAVILLLVGGAILRTSLTDLYLNYVKAGLRPFLVAAGVLLVATAIMTLWYDLRHGNRPAEAGSGHPDHGHDDDGHDHGHSHHGGPKVAWLLLLPVFALILVAPKALGAYAANKNGTALQHVSDFPPLPEGDPARISVLDYASRAVFDEGKSFQGRKVQLTGFILLGQNGKPYLARMMLLCCAADARPIKVGLEGSVVPADLKADTWVQVIGGYTNRFDKDPVNGETIPYLDVSELRVTPTPAAQYES